MHAHVEDCATTCRSYREQGRLAEAQAVLRAGLATTPDDVRLLVEQVLLDNANDHMRQRQTDARAAAREHPAVEIVVCVHNALTETMACLEAVCAKTRPPYFMTIVDDASAPEVGNALKVFAAAHPQVCVITNPSNLGYSKSANRGMKVARADWIVLLNSDAIVTTGWLEGLFEGAFADDAVAAVGPLSNAASVQTIPAVKTVPEDMADLVRRVSKKRHPKMAFLSGFCALISKEAMKTIGYLDEVNFPDYGVDGNMSLALLKAGYRIVVADDVYVHHASAASFGKGERRDRMIAEARGRLKSIWPGYDFGVIERAASLQLDEIKQEISRAC